MHCLKVELDGNELCVAGIVGRGVVTAVIDIVHERSKLNLLVGGLWYPEPGVCEKVTWANRALQTGSQVSVSLVEDRQSDSPQKRSQGNREHEDARKRDYRIHLQKKLEQYEAGVEILHQPREKTVPLALEVTLNGQRKCIAGHPLASVLGCLITCSFRSHQEGARYSDASLTASSRLAVNGLITHGGFENEHLTWVERGLHSGDVVAVEVKQTSELDEPSHRDREDPEEEARRAREYLGV